MLARAKRALLGVLCLIAFGSSDALSFGARFTHKVTSAVTGPEAVDFVPTLFGGSVSGPNGWAPVVKPDLAEENACEPLITSNLTGKWALISRGGGCSFDLKALHAQQAGARGVIIFPTLTPAFGTLPVTIPTITVQSNMLNFFLSDSSYIGEIFVQAAGAMDLVEAAAVREIAAATPWEFSGQGGVRSWANATDPNLDPCLNRLVGLWCQGGFAVSAVLSDGNGPVGSLHPSWGKLTKLENIAMANGKLTGPIPCELGNLSALQQLVLSNNQLSFLNASCIAKITGIQLLDLSYNRLEGQPFPALATLTGLGRLDLSHNRLTGGFSNYLYWPQTVSLAHNQLSGSLSFNSRGLVDLDLSYNQFNGTWPPMRTMPGARSIKINNNKLWGPLPSNGISAAPLLEELDFSNNLLNGSIPSTWAAHVPKLTTLRASNNAISSPITALASMTSLQYVDLSYNNITAVTGTPSQDGEFGALLFFALSPAMTTLILDHNKINAKFDAGWLSTLKQGFKLSAAYNQISSVPSDLLSAPWRYLDLSHNNLSGTFPVGEPSASMTHFHIQGNPNLTAEALPSWVQPSTSEMLKDVSSPYLCPQLSSSISSETSVKMDGVLYQYDGCVCEQGRYGTPPECPVIPNTVELTEATITHRPNGTPVVSTVFHDGGYGSQRTVDGMDTTWVVSAPVLHPLSTRKARAVILTLTFTPLFNSFTDVISIYEGGNDLSGVRIAQFRGTDFAGKSIPVTVIGTEATVHFTSRHREGTHFMVTAEIHYECPEGYELDMEEDRCKPIPPTFQSPTFVPVVVVVIAVVGLLLIGFIAFLLFIRRNSMMVRASSKSFVFIILFFQTMLSVASILYGFQPSEGQDGLCHARVWTTCIGLTGTLSALFAKTFRVSKIFGMKQLKVVRFKDSALFVAMVGMLTVQVVMCIVFSAFPFSKAVFEDGTGSTLGYRVHSCSQEDGFSTWLAVQIAYQAVFLLWGAFLAFRTRHAPSAFNESQHIMLSLIALFIIAIVVVPVAFMVDDNPDASMLVQGVGTSFATIALTLILFGPKVLHIILGNDNDDVVAKTIAVTSPADASHGRQENNVLNAWQTNPRAGNNASPAHAHGSNKVYTHNVLVSPSNPASSAKYNLGSVGSPTYDANAARRNHKSPARSPAHTTTPNPFRPANNNNAVQVHVDVHPK